MNAVQYGCGGCAPAGWLNFDASPRVLLEKITGPKVFPRNVRYGNIVRGLPLLDGSCDVVFASHVLEHLALDEFWRALANTRKLLRNGGVFRLVVPDMEKLANDYLVNRDVHAFMKATDLGMQTRPPIARRFGFTAHMWMWDELAMRRALTESGFALIRRANFGDSLPIFRAVELPWRFEGCLAMEATVHT